MTKKEAKNEQSNDKSQTGQVIKATVYEATENKDGGGTIHTKIYCFQTDQPILAKS